MISKNLYMCVWFITALDDQDLNKARMKQAPQSNLCYIFFVWKNKYMDITNNKMFISTNIFNSVICRSTFGSNYGFEPSWMSLNKLCTPGCVEFIFFFCGRSSQIVWEGSVNCYIRIYPKTFFTFWTVIGIYFNKINNGGLMCMA